MSLQGVCENVLAPPSPPWDEDDAVSMNIFESSKMCDMVDDFLSYSPDSLRLDSDTDDAINSFLLEAAAAVANPSSASSESGLEASIEMIHEDDDSNGTN